MVLTAIYLGKMSLRFLLFASTTVILFRKQRYTVNRDMMVCGIIFYCVYSFVHPNMFICTDRLIVICSEKSQ